MEKTALKNQAQERRKTNERPGSQELWRWNGPTVPVQRDILMNLMRILYQPQRSNGYNDMLFVSRTVDLLVSLLAANNALICHSFEGNILCI